MSSDLKKATSQNFQVDRFNSYILPINEFLHRLGSNPGH